MIGFVVFFFPHKFVTFFESLGVYSSAREETEAAGGVPCYA